MTEKDKLTRDDFIPVYGATTSRETLSWKWFFKGIIKIFYVLLTEPRIHVKKSPVNIKKLGEQQNEEEEKRLEEEEQEEEDDFDTEALDFLGD